MSSSATPSPGLSPQQASQYRQQGFLAPIDALSAERAAWYRTSLEQSEARFGPIERERRVSRAHLLFDWAAQLVREPAILAPVIDLIGPDILVFSSTVFPKAAGDGRFVSWHQDSTYHGLDPESQVSTWVALSDASVEAGCMEVLPGSHARGQVEHIKRPEAGNLLSHGQTIADLENGPTAFMPLKTGQLSLHDIFLIHRSGPNRSADRRIGVSISYVPTHCRNHGSQRLTATLVHGVDRYHHFDPEPRPGADYDDAARATHVDALARYGAMRRELFS